MEIRVKEFYSEPVLTTHDLLRDITGTTSGRVICQKSMDSACTD